jgi:hypothetical protein
MIIIIIVKESICMKLSLFMIFNRRPVLEVRRLSQHRAALRTFHSHALRRQSIAYIFIVLPVVVRGRPRAEESGEDGAPGQQRRSEYEQVGVGGGVQRVIHRLSA